MAKQAPQPISETGGTAGALVNPRAGEPAASQIQLRQEHTEMSLRELKALSQDLSNQIFELSETRKSVDECISIKHQEIIKLQQLAKESPEDLDDMLMGRDAAEQESAAELEQVDDATQELKQ
jgi:hypothetical protein